MTNMIGIDQIWTQDDAK